MKTVTTHITDDIDGTPGAHPIAFAVDGHSYEIDLTEPNLEKLYAALAPYIDNGRPARNHKVAITRKRTPVSTTTTARPAGTNSASIRQWWKDNPDSLPTWNARGAIPHAVQHAYLQTHA